MDLELLKNFLITSECLSISKAAERVNVTQPTLSRQILQLEKEFNVKLFKRKARALELTDDGFLFRRRAKEMLELYDITANELLAGVNDDIIGTVNISMGDLKSVKIIPPLIRNFRKRYPSVTFKLHTLTTDIAMENIERGILDMGIFTEPINLGKFSFISLPIKEELGVLMRPDDELASREYIQPVDLHNKPLIVAGNEPVKNQMEKWFSRYKKKMHVAIRTNLPTSSAILVGNGLGYAFLVKGAIEYWNPKLFIYKPLKPPIEYTSVLAWKKVQASNPAVERFIEFCLESIESLGKEEFYNID